MCAGNLCYIYALVHKVDESLSFCRGTVDTSLPRAVMI